MVEVPENDVQLTVELLSEWYEMSVELKALRAKEMAMRKMIFGKAFVDPKEGTNKFELPDGYVLNGQYKLERKIDQGALDALKVKLRDKQVNPDKLVEYKPSLVLREYRKLDEDARQLFDQCLIVKPGSPSMEVVLPKRAS